MSAIEISRHLKKLNMAKKDERLISTGELDAKYALPLHDTGKGEGERGIYRKVDADELGFKTTKDIPEPQGIERIVGQKEQVKAIMEGLAIKDPSFNILIWGGAEHDISKIIKLTSEEYAKTAKVENVDQIAWQNFNDPLNVNVASVPAGYGLGLRKTMESVLSQIANYIPDPTKIPDYFRETQAMNSESKMREELMQKNAITVMANQEIPVIMNGNTFCFDDTKRIVITPEQKAKAEAYVFATEKYIASKSAGYDEAISKLLKPETSPDISNRIKELLEEKASKVSEARQKALEELEAKGIRAKLQGDTISIQPYNEVNLDDETRIWAESYIQAREKLIIAQTAKIDEEAKVLTKAEGIDNNEIFSKYLKILEKRLTTEKELREETLAELAKKNVDAKIQGKSITINDPAKVYLDEEKKSCAESYIAEIKQSLAAETLAIDAEAAKLGKQANLFESPETFGKLYDAIYQKKIAESNIRHSAIKELVKIGITAKLHGKDILVQEESEAKIEILEEKRHIASAYLKTMQEQIAEIKSQYDEKKKKIEAECKKADMRRVIDSAYMQLLQQYEQTMAGDAYLFEPIRQYLAETFNHLIENPELVMAKKSMFANREASLEDFLPNVLVDNSGNKGIVMIEEANPDPFGLIGSVEPDVSKNKPYHTRMRAGDIARANKGIIAINNADLVFAPMGMLKSSLLKVLETGKLDIGDVAVHDLGLKAECNADVKFIVGVGGLGKHLSMWEDNENFAKYFKKKIMLERQIDYTPENIMEIAKAVKLEILENREKLPEFSNQAVARIIEYLLKDNGKEKIMLDLGFCKELIVRAGINARKDNKEIAGFSDIDAAYQGWKGEKDYYQRMYRELYKDRHFIIGEEPEVGVVNGLAVLSGGEIPFGNILRIGVTVTPQRGGSGEFHNIDKSAGMSGKTFTKSFLQVTSMIRELYQRTDRQLNFNLETSISQCDGGIDGPSAGAAMSLACLSALSGIPVQPNVFFTGGIDPKSGKITPVGGINEKVMGVYHTCKDREIKNAVAVIPDVNVDILQLVDEEVHEAVRKGEFKIYTHKQINETIEIGIRKNPEEVHDAVKQRLEEIQSIFAGKKKSAKKPLKKK